MEGGRSILGFPAWLGACRGRVLACGLLATSAVIASVACLGRDDSALLRSLAQRFNSPSNVFTEDENAVSHEPDRRTALPDVRQKASRAQPPALGLEIVPPTVIPIKVMTVPRVVVASPPSLGLTMDPPKVIPRRIVMPAVDPPATSGAGGPVSSPELPVPSPNRRSSITGLCPLRGACEPLQISV